MTLSIEPWRNPLSSTKNVEERGEKDALFTQQRLFEKNEKEYPTAIQNY